jgi:hypothetical protein
MAKSVADSVLDAALNKIGTATNMHANSAQPTTKTEADTTYQLATKATPTFTGPANGDTNGRKITVDAASSVTVDNSGVANHVSLTDATELLYVTTVTTPPTLNAGGTVNFGAWDVEIADPT